MHVNTSTILNIVNHQKKKKIKKLNLMSWHQNKLMIQCCNKHTLMDLSVTSDGKPATETFFERIEGVLLANFKT